MRRLKQRNPSRRNLPPATEAPSQKRLRVSVVLFSRKVGYTSFMPAHPHRPNFFYHLHPPTIPQREGSFRYTFGLGGISVLYFWCSPLPACC